VAKAADRITVIYVETDPRIYAPDAYVPDLVSDSSFQDAYSAAQNQTLLAVSTNVGTTDEVINAASGNTNGYFYIRVQGHTDQDFALPRVDESKWELHTEPYQD